MSVWVVIDVCDTERTDVVNFFTAADRCPPVSSFEQRHTSLSAAKQLPNRRHTFYLLVSDKSAPKLWLWCALFRSPFGRRPRCSWGKLWLCSFIRDCIIFKSVLVSLLKTGNWIKLAYKFKIFLFQSSQPWYVLSCLHLLDEYTYGELRLWEQQCGAGFYGDSSMTGEMSL